LPNGGVPQHMVLHPADKAVVLYCKRGEVRIIRREDWDREKAAAPTVCVLSEAEGAALAWFLRYWLGDRALKPGYDMRDKVKAEFDF